MSSLSDHHSSPECFQLMSSCVSLTFSPYLVQPVVLTDDGLSVRTKCLSFVLCLAHSVDPLVLAAKILIVYAHQSNCSFNAAAKDMAVKTFSKENVEVSDLYAMNFKATATADDITGTSQNALKFSMLLSEDTTSRSLQKTSKTKSTSCMRRRPCKPTKLESCRLTSPKSNANLTKQSWSSFRYSSVCRYEHTERLSMDVIIYFGSSPCTGSAFLQS